MKANHKSWQALKNARCADRMKEGERLLAKAFELAEDGDLEAAERHFFYAIYQAQRVFCLRKGFKLEAK